MAAKAGRYFGRPFKGYQGVTQVYPLSPTIFNMAVDSFIRHWLMLVMPSYAGMGSIGLTIIDLVAYFYADDGLVASTQPERLKRAVDFLTVLFNKVGLQTNTAKMVGMVFHTCHAPGGGGVTYPRKSFQI